MCFIKNNALIRRQNGGIFKTTRLLPDSQIGKQQVVICDDDPGSGGLPAERVEVAVFPVKTFGPMTLIRGGGYGVPKGIIVAQPIEFGAIREPGPLQPFLEAIAIGRGLSR